MHHHTGARTHMRTVAAANVDSITRPWLICERASPCSRNFL